MSLKRTQREVDSIEFAEWLQVYTLEAEMMDPNHEPTPEQLGDKLSAWAAMHNAGTRGKVSRERR